MIVIATQCFKLVIGGIENKRISDNAKEYSKSFMEK